MKNPSQCAKKFSALLRLIKSEHVAEPQDPAEPVAQIVMSFLEWNATRRQARAAYRRLMEQHVDLNDLRISHPHEVVSVLGSSYPQAEERTARMHEALNEIFAREQILRLDVLDKKSKKDVRAYFNDLPGVPSYVAAQMTLLCYDGHAIPVDDHLANLLRQAEVVDPDATVAEIESFLEHQIRAEAAVDTHTWLMAWVGAGSRRVWPDGGTRKSAVPSKKIKATPARGTGKTKKQVTKKKA